MTLCVPSFGNNQRSRTTRCQSALLRDEESSPRLATTRATSQARSGDLATSSPLAKPGLLAKSGLGPSAARLNGISFRQKRLHESSESRMCWAAFVAAAERQLRSLEHPPELLGRVVHSSRLHVRRLAQPSGRQRIDARALAPKLYETF